MPRIHRAVAAGTIFGEWTILREDIHVPGKRGLEYRYMARCSCGVQRVVSWHSLKLGRSRSCGCKKVEAWVAKITKHGRHKSKIYGVWEAMLDRCRNPAHPSYPDYGGRGIRVCGEWHRFEAFLRDMGEKPEGMSLDRIDNSRDYEPGNCRWTDAKTQTRNTRRNRIVILDGTSMCATDAAHFLGVAPPNLWKRAQEHDLTMQQAVDYYAARRS
jgi:hypothetical protein